MIDLKLAVSALIETVNPHQLNFETSQRNFERLYTEIRDLRTDTRTIQSEIRDIQTNIRGFKRRIDAFSIFCSTEKTIKGDRAIARLLTSQQSPYPAASQHSPVIATRPFAPGHSSPNRCGRGRCVPPCDRANPAECDAGGVHSRPSYRQMSRRVPTSSAKTAAHQRANRLRSTSAVNPHPTKTASGGHDDWSDTETRLPAAPHCCSVRSVNRVGISSDSAAL